MTIENPGFPPEETSVLEAWLRLVTTLQTLAERAGNIMPPLEATPPDLVAFQGAVRSMSAGLREFQANCSLLQDAVLIAKCSHEADVLAQMN